MNKDIEIFLKFNEEKIGESNSTIKEHLDIYERDGIVAWGQFTTNKNNHGITKKKIILKQIHEGKKVHVFFYNREEELLYVSELEDIINESELNEEKTGELRDRVPDYYKSLVAKNISELGVKPFAYVYFIVKNIKKLDMKFINLIYTDIKGEPILDVKGTSPLFYVHLDEKLLNKLSQ